jgi:flagellar motility protein MotE (MotC chaperone)
VSLDYSTLAQLRRSHPGWRLLLADHAPLIVSFLQRTFIESNVRVMAQPELESHLDDVLYQLRETEGESAFPRSARDYLDDWAQNDRGWLRKFYPPASDEAHFDLTPATEKAIAWLESLAQRAFVGTESRLMTVFELLRQMVSGSETDAQSRIEELERRRDDIEREIARVRAGEIALLDDTALRDRFQQVSSTARELLSDFREVEHNFRQLDLQVREQIATWEGRKGELLAQIFGERDAIADSDQGRSFRAFWDFLMSPASQDELTDLLEKAFSLEAVNALSSDRRLKRIHYDWLDAGEHTQRTVARLSQQLRRYLDDQAYLENRRIMQLLDGISARALAVREQTPQGNFFSIDAPAPTVLLPMERPLFCPPARPLIDAEILSADASDITTDALYEQHSVDKPRLKAQIRQLLQNRQQVTLAEVVARHPLQQGLAELVTYLSIAGADRQALFDDDQPERIGWQDDNGRLRQAQLPRIIFTRH